MKKISLLLKMIFVYGLLAHAQQGVSINTDGTNADASAMLDIKSSAKGLLIPRMSSAQRSGIVSPAKGLMVFDTDVNGFWFYDGSAWKQIAGGGAIGTGWSTIGNGSTDPASNFLGTTDNIALNIRTNNQTRLTIAENGNIGINNTVPSAKLDVKSTTGTTSASFYFTGNNSVNVNGITSVGSNSGTGGSFGGNFTAVSNGGNSIAAGVSSYAQSGFNNYAFFGGVLTSAGQNGWGIYATATGSASTVGGYLKGDGTGVAGIGGGYGGYFSGGGVGVDAIGQTGGRFKGTYKGLDVSMSTATDKDGFSQYGIYSEVKNPAVTDHVIGVFSQVEGNNAPGNVIAFYAKPIGPGHFISCFYGEGNINISGSYFSSSDGKLKKNIKPINKIMDKIMQLSPSTYEYRTDEYDMNLPKGNQFGLVAQDVEKIFPELVAQQVKPASFNQTTKEKISDEVKYLGVNYTGLIPIIISGVQEQEQKIKALELENAQLKKDIAQIKSKLGL